MDKPEKQSKKQVQVLKLLEEQREEIILDFITKNRAIDTEVASIKLQLLLAFEKHSNWPSSMHKQLSIITEEVGEIAQAILKYQDENGNSHNIRTELRQAAAMCIRMLLGFDKSLKYISNDSE